MGFEWSQGGRGVRVGGAIVERVAVIFAPAARGFPQEAVMNRGSLDFTETVGRVLGAEEILELLENMGAIECEGLRSRGRWVGNE